MIKQVIIMRKDLNMRKGKLVAQGAHASMAIILKQGHFWSMPGGPRYGSFSISFEKGMKDLYEWLTGLFAKICVSVDSEAELLAIYAQAEEAHLPCALITDAGLTEFHGIPTVTCCAIGPAESEEIDKITGHLKLL